MVKKLLTSSFYNAPSVSINKVSAFKLTDKIDINNLNRDETSALKEFDLKNPSKEGYSYKDNKNGTGDLKILYPSEDNIALYIEYTVNKLLNITILRNLIIHLKI